MVCMKKNGNKKPNKLKRFIIVVTFVLIVTGCITYLIYNSKYNIRFRVENYDKDYIVNYGSQYESGITVCYGRVAYLYNQLLKAK